TSGASLSFAAAAGTYYKIGDLVVAFGNVTYPATASGASSEIGNLPFTVASSVNARQGFIGYTTESSAARVLAINSSTVIRIYGSTGLRVTNSALSGDDLYF